MVMGLVHMLRLTAHYPARFAWFVLASLCFSACGGGMVFVVREATAMLTNQQTPAWLNTHVNPVLRLIHPELALTPNLRRAYFALLLGTLFLVFFKCLTQYMQRYLQAWLTRRVVMEMQGRLGDHLLQQDLGYFHTERTGELLSRFTNDLMFLGRSVKFATVLLTRPIMLAAYIIAIFVINWYLAILGLIGLPLAAIFITTLSRKMRRASKQAMEKRADLTNALIQFLTGMHIVKAFGCEDFESRQFHGENRQLFDFTMKRERARARVRPLVEFVSMLGTLLAMAVGGEWIFNGTLSPEDLFAFLAALGMMYAPAKDLSRANSDLQEALPGADRVFQLLNAHPSIEEGTHKLTGFEKDIVFDQVFFRYEEDKPVLEGINLTISKGSCVALVGPSGGGKSTLADLIPRFYDPREGTIQIDGHNLREVTFKSLRDQIAIVSQEPFLFNSSVRDNIAYGRSDATPEAIEAAARAANIHDEILAMPEGYNTMAGERGGNLSGGQRQRVAIARAIFKDAPILILDEATSALDSESEKKVQEALNHLLEGRTSLIIAHRLSTIRHADQILLLEQHRIAAQGTHDQLMEKNPTYAHMVHLQDTRS